MLLKRDRLSPVVLIDPLEGFAGEQAEGVDHLVHLDLVTVAGVDPVHAVQGDTCALAVNVIDEKLANEDGGVGVAFSYALDHFSGSDRHL